MAETELERDHKCKVLLGLEEKPEMHSDEERMQFTNNCSTASRIMFFLSPDTQ